MMQATVQRIYEDKLIVRVWDGDAEEAVLVTQYTPYVRCGSRIVVRQETNNPYLRFVSVVRV